MKSYNKAHGRRDEESVLVEHEGKDHGGSMVTWTMKAKGFPRGNLSRQALEAHLISTNSKKMNLLNRRGSGARTSPQS